jgi:hypothetical protein
MIELYTGKGCAACVTLKNRLLDLGISNYEPRSTDTMVNRDFIMGLGFRSIPVMVKRDTQGNILGSMQGALMCDEVLMDFFELGQEGVDNESIP